MDFSQALRSVIHDYEPSTFASSGIGVNNQSLTQGCSDTEQRPNPRECCHCSKSSSSLDSHKHHE